MQIRPFLACGSVNQRVDLIAINIIAIDIVAINMIAINIIAINVIAINIIAKSKGGSPRSVGQIVRTMTQIFLVCGFLACGLAARQVLYNIIYDTMLYSCNTI